MYQSIYYDFTDYSYYLRDDKKGWSHFNFKMLGFFQGQYGCNDAILFNSGGSANLAMLQALKNMGKLQDGDQVGFSALTWSTNTMPILQMGFVPVPLDCEVATLNVMSANLEGT